MKAWKHENADSLYVEEIDVGEEKPRTVCSGLVKFIPLDQMQNRTVLLVCNLKESNMRGVVSQAMVLAASNDDHTDVKLVDVPAGSKIGERLAFTDYPGEPETGLDKKRIGEVLPDLHTDANGQVMYKEAVFKTSAGICTASLHNAHVG